MTDMIPEGHVLRHLLGDQACNEIERATAACQPEPEAEPLVESVTVELQKSDVIRMLKGGPAPFGMDWDERAMNASHIDELMALYASIHWGPKQNTDDQPRIYIPG